jgi:hypothetical protein
MVRVRARPSRPKLISMPIFRKKFAARRSRPAKARGFSGRVLDLATRSPASRNLCFLAVRSPFSAVQKARS